MNFDLKQTDVVVKFKTQHNVLKFLSLSKGGIILILNKY